MRTSTRYALALICIGLIGLTFLLWEERSASVGPQPRALGIPGWDRLDPCSFVSSFDELRTLTFSPRQRVTLSERDDPKAIRPAREKTGEWSYDETRKRYSVIVDNETKQYALLAPPKSDVCILASGSEAAVNLPESWFGKRQIEYEQDVGP
jgi:hypothetical protein